MSTWPPAARAPSGPLRAFPADGQGPGRSALRASARSLAALAALVALLLTTACLGDLPKDSQGTLDRATGGTLRVGISEHPPFTVVDGDGTVSGTEVDLLHEYAARIEADIQWTPGPESALSAAMKAGRLDIVIGGFTDDSPFTSTIAFTRPYAALERPDGSTGQVVMGVRPGENALMVDLELFLAESTGEL